MGADMDRFARMCAGLLLLAVACACVESPRRCTMLLFMYAHEQSEEMLGEWKEARDMTSNIADTMHMHIASYSAMPRLHRK
jgi:hypothetical protein